MADLSHDDEAAASVVHSADGFGSPLVWLSGELDISNVEAVRSELDSVVEGRPRRLVFELGGLSFMDSSGIDLLVEVAQHVGRVELRNPSALIRRIIEATGLSEIPWMAE